jgi:hypothetical protein
MAVQMHIFLNVEDGTVKIEKVMQTGAGGGNPNVPKQDGNGPAGRELGKLVTFTGSNCVSLNIPGGGFYQICF